MRSVIIKAKKGGRPLIGRREFYERDIESGLKGCLPGEWVLVSEEGQSGVVLLAMANPMSQKSAPVRVIKSLSKSELIVANPEAIIKALIDKAIQKRRLFSHMDKGARLIYGDEDRLPGVIVDEYLHCAIIQINTAGMDTYRNFIKEHLGQSLSKPCYFLDNQQYRESEGLPQFEKDEIPDLEIEENGLKFFVKGDVLQKVGYYYDHRPNRDLLQKCLLRFNGPKKSAVDLFSYVGSWGLHALAGGIEHVDFVDQGNFEDTVECNLKCNNFEGKGSFYRANVFDWVKNCKKTYDLVISDPPAFSKSLKNKSKALGGYQKLHKSLVPLVHDQSLLAIGSCTHGITLEELDQTVELAFRDSAFQCHLVDLGVQGADHPMGTLNGQGHYIKFLLYLVSKK